MKTRNGRRKAAALTGMAAVMAAATLMTGACTISSQAEETGNYGEYGFVADDADLLTEEEQSDLQAKLEEIGKTHGIEIAVVTTDSYAENSIMSFADNTMDYNDWGFAGSTSDKAIELAVCMSDRSYAVCTETAAATIFTDDRIYELEDLFLDDLSSGDYYDSFAAFADGCDKICYRYEKSGSIFGAFYEVEPWKWFLCVVMGLFLGFLPVAVMTSGMKTVHMNNSAGAYEGNGGVRLNRQYDRFIRKSVNRVRIEHNSSSGGGSHSTMHSSSSGHSHGGHSGHF